MPNRMLREGIITSPRINALSIGAELFYRRLMSIVDDYGRFYGHPTTLRTLTWPTCPNKCTDDQVRIWLDELTTGDDPLILWYQIGRAPYIQIRNFRQRTRSTKSKFPGPPTNGGHPADIPPTIDGDPRADGGQTAANGAQPAASTVHCEIQHRRQLSAECGGNSALDGDVDGKTETAASDRRVGTSMCGNVENSPPPLSPLKTPPLFNSKTNGKTHLVRIEKPPRGVAEPENAVSMMAVTPADREYLKASLSNLAREVHLPEPDDGIVGKVFEVCRGATGAEIHEALRKLFIGGRFRDMRSWGLIPLVLETWFSHQAS